jgi:vacuolar-type H+-ATPase subunit F/Vma7
MAEVAIAFIGDEIAAQGYRLAGARAITPAPGEELASFETACTEAAVVLVTSACAARLPADLLEAARMGTRPLVLVLPSGVFGDEPYGAARKAQRLLGVEP